MRKLFLGIALVSLFSLVSCDGTSVGSLEDTSVVSSETSTSIEGTYKLSINTNDETYYGYYLRDTQLTEFSLMEKCYGENADDYVSLGMYHTDGARTNSLYIREDTTIYLNSITKVDYNENYVIINVNNTKIPVKKNETLAYDYIWQYVYVYGYCDDVSRWGFYTDNLYINKYNNFVINETVDLYYAEVSICQYCSLLVVSPELKIKKDIYIDDLDVINSYDSTQDLIIDNFDGTLENYNITGLYDNSNFSIEEDNIRMEKGYAYLIYIDVEIITND